MLDFNGMAEGINDAMNGWFATVDDAASDGFISENGLVLYITREDKPEFVGVVTDNSSEGGYYFSIYVTDGLGNIVDTTDTEMMLERVEHNAEASWDAMVALDKFIVSRS